MDLRLGGQYYDPESERRVTVIEVSDGSDGRTALVQYDDGKASTISGDFDSAHYVTLPVEQSRSSSLPKLTDACVEGSHSFPDEQRDAALGRGERDYYPRCERCGLSSSVAIQFLGHSITASVGDVCDDCGCDISSPDDRHEDVEGKPICPDCWADYHDVWKMPTERIVEQYAFHDPACGWFSDQPPEEGRTCPDCETDRVSIVDTDSSLYETLRRTRGEEM